MEILVVTADGGAKFPLSHDPDCGAGIVVMVYKGGIANIIAEIALPLFEASNAQEAEAIASWVAIGSLEWALNRARSLGFNPMPPDLSL
eukprot:8927960-Heterocapsa_arctica.AAC.1